MTIIELTFKKENLKKNRKHLGKLPKKIEVINEIICIEELCIYNNY